MADSIMRFYSRSPRRIGEIMSNKQYKVIVDTEGSDKGAEMIVKGAAMALNIRPAGAVRLF